MTKKPKPTEESLETYSFKVRHRRNCAIRKGKRCDCNYEIKIKPLKGATQIMVKPK